MISLRLRAHRKQLICLLPLHPKRSGSRQSGGDLILVASSTAPYLRRLVVYHQSPRYTEPDEPPHAA